ncbi:zonular occludens toxin domain-containing protein [Nevskia ramosa]|uniref:zonular occludens toxin domain-containing protein n=1 Tax=Nevskia ramosa TaxID=64002 RepID=UPI003D152C67
MILLITGNPGSGKTLWTLPEVLKLAKDWADKGTPRQVYYNGIPLAPEFPGFKTDLPWKELTDAEMSNPHIYPEGSIFVIDEAYRLYEAPRKAGVPITENIQKFATHRHRGHDFYLICQKPSQLHHFIRDLVGRHVHFERAFGLPRARRFAWERLGDISDKWDKKASSASEFWYPKDVYGWYKSSDMHTVQNRMPWLKLAGIAALALAVPLLLWNVFSSVGQGLPGTESKAPSASSLASAVQGRASPSGVAVDASMWAAKWQERVPGIPYSAPAYDEVAKVAVFPKISGCLEVKAKDYYRCSCDSQQGTRLTTVTETQCRHWLKNGWFDFSQVETAAGGSSGFQPSEPPAMTLSQAPAVLPAPPTAIKAQ